MPIDYIYIPLDAQQAMHTRGNVLRSGYLIGNLGESSENCYRATMTNVVLVGAQNVGETEIFNKGLAEKRVEGMKDALERFEGKERIVKKRIVLPYVTMNSRNIDFAQMAAAYEKAEAAIFADESLKLQKIVVVGTPGTLEAYSYNKVSGKWDLVKILSKHVDESTAGMESIQRLAEVSKEGKEVAERLTEANVLSWSLHQDHIDLWGSQ